MMSQSVVEKGENAIYVDIMRARREIDLLLVCAIWKRVLLNLETYAVIIITYKKTVTCLMATIK